MRLALRTLGLLGAFALSLAGLAIFAGAIFTDDPIGFGEIVVRVVVIIAGGAVACAGFNFTARAISAILELDENGGP